MENYKSDTVITGTAGADYIYNHYGYRVKIDTGAGNDSINNRSSDNVTILSGNGDDTIDNYSSDNSLLNGGKGSDSIHNYGDSVTIAGGDGNDTIYNSSSRNVSINGGAGNDSIYNYGYLATLDGGKGDDTIYNHHWSEVLFKYSGGNDSISGFGSESTLQIASGKLDTLIKTNGSDYFLSVGNSTITLQGAAYYANRATIVNSKGKVIKFALDKNIIGSNGNDYFGNCVDGATISAGKGNDTIYNDYGVSNVLIMYGGGNDSISGFNDTSTLQIASGTMNSVVKTNGSDYFISVGNSTITLESVVSRENVNISDSKGKAIKFTIDKNIVGTSSNDNFWNHIEGARIKLGDGNDSIYNSVSNVSINAGNDNDYISNSRFNDYRADKVTILGDSGNDTISNYNATNVNISGGAGNDSIKNHELCNSAIISGGDGDDTILNIDSYNVTIGGGAGNDSILFSYASGASISGGDGNDSIVNGYGGSSDITINGGKGNDIINLDDWFYNGLIQYSQGDGNDTIYDFDSDDTIQIATNSNYTTQKSGYDLIIKVGNESITFKSVYFDEEFKLNIVTKALPKEDNTGDGENTEEFRAASASALNEFIEIGKGTDTVPSYTSKDSSINKLVEKVSKSSIYIVRLMGKVFGEKTKYKLKADGSPETDRNGNPIKDTSPSKTIITAGYNALLNVDSILTSAKKIAGGKLSDDKLLKEELNISTQTAALVDNISKLGGDPKAGIITPLGSATVGLATNVINGFVGGIDKSVVTGFTNNFKTLLTETLKKLDKNPALKDTALGTWLKGKAAGTKIESFVDKIVGKTVVDHIGTAVSSFLGIYSAVTTYLDSTEQYNIDGLPDASATINKTIDVIADGIHSFSNAVISGATAGILNADTIFTGVYNVAAAVKWSFQHGWALATGGDVSKVKFQTEDRNFTEILGDFVKGLVTGTTKAKDVFNEKNKKKIYTEGNEDNHITNFGSQCTINSGVGKDLVFNHEGTKSNYVDAGNDDDTVVAYGTSNSILGGQGNDRIALYSDGKTPAGGNILDGGAGSDQILIDDTAYATLPRKSNNTIIGGQGDDLIAIEDTKIPVVLRYKAGDGNDYVFGYDKNDTIQIVNSEYATKKSGQDVVITIGKGSVTLISAKGKKLNIEKITDDSLPKGLSYDKKKTTITASTKFVDEQIDLSNYAATVTKVKASSLVTGVNIVGNALDNEIIGGKGSDTVNGGAGNDTLTGGKGNDSLKGGADADILKGEDDNDKLYGEAGNDTLDGGKGNDELYGGAGNDCLVGGKGSDTLTGGKGNDSLWGNAGVDTFIYGKGDGQDIIYGFDKTDLLQITGTFSASYSKAKKEIYFDVGTTTNAITLKDFGSTASFNVNGTNYKISGTKLIKK